MQNSQEISWWLEIAKVVIPSLVALIAPFIAYSWLAKKMKEYENSLSTDLKSYESALNHKLENYRNELNKGLETHKVQLQSEFQKNFYEFQTRFSILHQKKAEAIKDLFALLAETEFILNSVSIPYYPYDNADFNRRRRRQSLEIYEKTLFFFIKNRIYFDEELCVKIDEILKEMSDFIGLLINTESKNYLTSLKSYNMTYKKINKKIKPIRKELENTFRLLLAVESQNQ